MLDIRGIVFQFLTARKHFSVPSSIQIGSVVHLASQFSESGRLFPRKVKRSRHEVFSPSNLEVKNGCGNTTIFPLHLHGAHRDVFTFTFSFEFLNSNFSCNKITNFHPVSRKRQMELFLISVLRYFYT